VMQTVGRDAGRMAAAPPVPPPPARREARLLPEHAAHYPGLIPEQWEAAATLADRVHAGRLLRGRELVHPGRILVDAHFEFCGGESRGALSSPRPRREDR